MGKYVVQWWLILLLYPSSIAGQAQSTVLYFNEPPKETLRPNRNQLIVNQFFSDRDDFLWFISNGLNRYDGHEIVSIRSNPIDLNSLSSSSVIDMIQDEKGNFWITTRDGGLNAYNPQTGKVAHFRHVPTNKASLSTDKLRFLQRDESGKIWIGSDWGMNQFDPKTGQTVRFLPRPGEAGQLQGNPLSPIVVETGHIYVSTTVGFEYYNRTSKKWHCFPALDRKGIPIPNVIVGNNSSNSLCKDRTGLIWMGIPNQTGLRVFNPKTGQIIAFDARTADGKPIPYPTVILEDRSGRLWLCCANDIYRISADRTLVENCTPVAVENEERLTELQTLYEDRQGLIWLVRHGDKNPLFFDTRQERYPNLQMPQLGNRNPLASHILHDPTGRDRSGSTWISTDLGLIHHNPIRNDARFVLTGLTITSASLLPGNYLLVISEDDGLFIFDKKTGRITPVRLNSGGTIQAPIFSVLDQDGDLWISTWGYGLFHIPQGSLSLETGVVKRYEQWKNDPADPNSLASNLLQKIAVDAKNNVWVCGAANGLCRVSKRDRRVQRFMLRQGDPDGIAGNYTYAPLIDKQGDVWVMSGFSAPLQRLSVKTGRFKKYGIADGFTDEYFAHATMDETGKIWFNQNHVVSCIDPVTEKVNTFPQFVGTSAYATPIAARLGTGEVYFSCQNNLRRFTPALIENALRTPSPLRLEAVSSFDADGIKAMKPLAEDRWRGKELALSYMENTLEIKFALLDYRNVNNREYAYALTSTNEEPQWVNIGLNHTVDFAQLRPGTYLFHLKARNSDGIWTKLETPLRIAISPPWWLSPWAYVTYALLLLFGFWYLMKARLRGQARELALREAVVIRQQRDEIAQKNSQNELLLKEVHHRVKNNLGVVSGLLALQSAKVHDPKVLEAIQASQNRVLSMSIIHQKLYQGEQLGAIEMRDYFAKLAESILHSFGMTDRISIDCPMPELMLDIDTAISIGLITNELLTNSLKYAFVGRDIGTIRISLTRLGDNSLLLQVADNGIGKITVETAKETGFGTQLIDLLTRQLDGSIIYENQEGTLVKLQFNRPATAHGRIN
ncbi:histidine kinase dimerization/phosphoacceptor domain -containing protein [Dyadobacter arcticus]|uniref:histidine kinase n=1 Tax=Dyadobacter arcticus TaxID=1078754 RepID=A0ABX0UI30_9BACT|nr:histidine kinase dimerization/phosphoacceptor domain -containing protein [Dyadobacter arcticus]NIJ52688.1 two-component sensor histidine kinase/ligand-binding sensor domain-containing protein [Dyadobacter arcticus]